ncbi:glycosomal membrane protein [Diplonema papillatum]|nr:glycosomal membrane protein [Diplonema papillatum]
MNKDDLRHAIAFFDKADGRDKLFKTLQNWCKVLVWRYTILALTGPNEERPAARVTAKKYKGIATALSEFRSLGKFFKWFKNISEIQELTADPQRMSIGDAVDTISNVCDAGYKLSDNVEFLSKYKVLTMSPAEWETRSKAFQFWAYLTAVIVDCIALVSAGKPTAEEEKMSGADMLRSMKKRAQQARLVLARDVADFLRVAAGRGHLTAVIAAPITPAFAGLMGTVSGAIGTYLVWEKTAPKK